MTEAEICAILARHEKRLRELEARRAISDSRHDPKRWRREKLRYSWRVFYAGLSRAAAAQAIAIDWAAYASSQLHEPAQRGTLNALFAELTEAGCRPLGARTVFDDLDPKLDPHG